MAYRRIHIKGPYEYEEYECAEAITPGMLVMLDEDGKAAKHNEQGGRGEAMFAMEDVLQGNPVSTAYSASNQGCFMLPGKGCCVAALIASGEVGDEGMEVVSAGNGLLQMRGSSGSGLTEWQTIGILQEAFTALAANTLKKIRIV